MDKQFTNKFTNSRSQLLWLFGSALALSRELLAVKTHYRRLTLRAVRKVRFRSSLNNHYEKTVKIVGEGMPDRWELR